MNKNTLFAFILILGSVMFFTSPTYNKIQAKLFGIKTQDIVIPPIQKEIRKDDKKELSEIKELLQHQPVDSTTIQRCDTIWLENEKIKVDIKEEGAIITSIIMKNFNYKNHNIDLLEQNTEGGGQLSIANKNYD